MVGAKALEQLKQMNTQSVYTIQIVYIAEMPFLPS